MTELEIGQRVWVPGVYDRGTLHNPLGVVLDIQKESGETLVTVRFNGRDGAMTFPADMVHRSGSSNEPRGIEYPL
jgi:hypothetical protein